MTKILKEIEKKIKNELKMIFYNLEKERFLIKKSENFSNFKYSIFIPIKDGKELIGLVNFLSNNSTILKKQNLIYLKEISNQIHIRISRFLDKRKYYGEREGENKNNKFHA